MGTSPQSTDIPPNHTRNIRKSRQDHQSHPIPLTTTRSGTIRKRGIGLLLLIGLTLLIAAPFSYRALRPQLRESIKRYLPVMAVFDPQRSYAANALPTVAPAIGSNSAEELLASPRISPDEIKPTDDPQPLVIIVTATPPSVPAVEPTSKLEQTEILPTPTAANTPAPIPTAVAPVAVAALPASGRINGFTHVYQGWNNCGPATITMALSYFGWTNTQDFAASFMKPDPEDKNVSPWQMVRYVNEQTGYRAITRMGGNLDLLRRLITAQFPVIIETGFMPEGYDWMGHYRLVIGYDNGPEELYMFDSYLGHNNFQGIPFAYGQFDKLWQDFNRTYIVVYDQSREAELREIIGDNADLVANARNALEVARQEATANPQDPFAWFNMGTSYLSLNMPQEAATAFDQARNAGSGLPWRMLWYQFGPYDAYLQVGRVDDVLALARANLGTTTYVEETYYWMGKAYAALGDKDQAAAQFNLALQHNRNFTPATEALAALQTE